MPPVDISQAAVQSAASRAAVIDGVSDGQRGWQTEARQQKNQTTPYMQPTIQALHHCVLSLLKSRVLANYNIVSFL